MASPVPILHVVAAIAAFAVAIVAINFCLFLSQMALRRQKLQAIPMAPGSLPGLGHLFSLANHPLPWELMLDWCHGAKSDIVHWFLPFEDWIIIRGGDAMREVLQTRFRDFSKEMAMSFHPFLCILGTGLVTSHGKLWQKQRKIMTPAFKGDILQEVIGISVKATSRLCGKLDACKVAGSSVEMDEEFRLLTLQVRC
jgi:beta-ring hydroxylase